MPREPELVRLRDKVNLDFRVGIPSTFAKVEILLTDGTRLSATHDAGIPATDTADQGRRLEEKFVGLVEPVLGSQRCQALICGNSRFRHVGEFERTDATYRSLETPNEVAPRRLTG